MRPGRKTFLPQPVFSRLKAIKRWIGDRAIASRNRMKYGTSDFFNDLNIEINTSCNRRCSYCPNSVFERSLIQNEQLMDAALFRKVIDDLAQIDWDGRISPHFYGEPLLDARLLDFVGYVRDRLPSAKTVLVSNGDMLSPEKYDELVVAGVKAFQITEHGKKPKPGMAALLESYAKKRGPAPIEYTKFVDETPLHNRGGLVEVTTVSTEPRCAQPRNPLVIDWEGNVVLCCNDYHSEVVFGNVREQNLIDIWHSSEFTKMREQLRQGRYELPICRRCVGLEAGIDTPDAG